MWLNKKLRALVSDWARRCICIYAIGICKIHTHPNVHVVPPHALCAERDGDTGGARWEAFVFTSFVRWSLTTPWPPISYVPLVTVPIPHSPVFLYNHMYVCTYACKVRKWRRKILKKYKYKNKLNTQEKNIHFKWILVVYFNVFMGYKDLIFSSFIYCCYWCFAGTLCFFSYQNFLRKLPARKLHLNSWFFRAHKNINSFFMCINCEYIMGNLMWVCVNGYFIFFSFRFLLFSGSGIILFCCAISTIDSHSYSHILCFSLACPYRHGFASMNCPALIPFSKLRHTFAQTNIRLCTYTYVHICGVLADPDSIRTLSL